MATNVSAFGVAVDSAGAVYISDFMHQPQVLKVTGGSPPKVLPFTGLQTPVDVMVDGNTVYVSDKKSGVMKLGQGSGSATKMSVSNLTYTWGMAVNGGNIYFLAGMWVIQQALDSGNQTRVTFDGLPSTSPRDSHGSLADPRGIAIDSHGNFYVSDMTQNFVVKRPPDSTPRPCCRSPASSSPAVWRWTAPATCTLPTRATIGC